MASKDEEACSIMDEAVTIRPPRLEDAGLEDCALPLDSIMEAFARAAVISSGPRASDEEDAEEDEIATDTRVRDTVVEVEDSSGRKQVENEVSDNEEASIGYFVIDARDIENEKDAKVVT